MCVFIIIAPTPARCCVQSVLPVWCVTLPSPPPTRITQAKRACWRLAPPPGDGGDHPLTAMNFTPAGDGLVVVTALNTVHGFVPQLKEGGAELGDMLEELLAKGEA